MFPHSVNYAHLGVMSTFAIPEQTVAGEQFVIDAGSGSADFTVGNDATELVIGIDSIVLNLAITSPGSCANGAGSTDGFSRETTT